MKKNRLSFLRKELNNFKLDGYIIPKEETLVFKAKIIPIDEAFCFTGLTINDNEHDTTNVILGECKTGLSAQQLALLKTMEKQEEEVEILSGEHAKGKGTILQTTVEGKYDILTPKNTKTRFQQLLGPHGSKIWIMGILSTQELYPG